MQNRRAMSRVDLGRKLPGRTELKEAIDAERRAGRRIVFTNGCFDLLHVGHVRYLAAARAKGDVLVVAANADETVRRLKGPNRPVLPIEQRLRVLAALASVSYAVEFAEDTPHALLRELRPDVLVKGADYGVEGVVGREVVWEYGGEVCVVCHTEGISTTKTLERIRGLGEATGSQ
jgi:D-beta-D-heptose 7-phosphate kinase/D-beta-D-heptose 1-phosphate adenosyltransferase